MKKVFLSLLIVFCIILLTGCGSKVDYDNSPRVVCQKTESTSEGSVYSRYTLLFDKNDKLTHFKADVDIAYSQEMPKEAISVTERAMKLIGLTPGIDFESNMSEHELRFSFAGKVKMLKTIMMQLNNNYDENSITGDTKQEALKEFTSSGHTCEEFE